MATLLHPDGRSETVTPRDGKAFKLPELYEHVACDVVEAVVLADKRVMFVDEIAKLKPVPPPFNHEATMLFAVNRAWYDPVIGRALVCTPTEAGEEDEG